MSAIEKFIEESNAAEDSQTIFKLYMNAMAQFGFDRVCYSLITDHPSLGLHKGHGVFRNYPEEWMKHYVANGYEKVDPVPKNCFHTRKPFEWDGLETGRILLKNEKKVMIEAREANLFTGIGVPLHGINGELAGVGLASSATGADHDKNTLAKIQALSFQFHLVYSEKESSQPKVLPDVQLTLREKEILSWVAEGKSDQVIADILNTSYATVRFHMNNIFVKLEANDRILAVVKAIRLGLILPNYVK